ncbi:hypothetical protein [Achromobacter denitrificans]|uniref:hypothetical protein n=1 Tax=Achromobacter denitrificans TaxID=32002 RepID=UPI003D0393D6
MEKLLVIAGAALFFNVLLAAALIALGMRFGYLRWGDGKAEKFAQLPTSAVAIADPTIGMGTNVDLPADQGPRLFALGASSIEIIVKLGGLSVAFGTARLLADSTLDEQNIDFGVAAPPLPRAMPAVPSQAIAFC